MYRLRKKINVLMCGLYYNMLRTVYVGPICFVVKI